MTKADFVAAVAKKTGLTKKDVEATMKAYHETVVSEIKKGGEVSMPGFGKFVLVKRAARKGINPLTKKPISIPARKALAFKATKALKDL